MGLQNTLSEVGKKDGEGEKKSGMVSQMVFGCFPGRKKGPFVGVHGDLESKRGGVSSRSYLHILNHHIKDFHQDDWIFMQDNARIHTAKAVIKWFDDNHIILMIWPPYSPDLNPIEHIWPILKENMHQHYPELAHMKGGPKKVKKELEKALIHCWDLIEPSVFENLARTMPNRVRAVIEANGWYTKY